MIEYIRGNEDDEVLQALGIVVIRILIGSDVSLKQLFLAHGGMNLIMALHQYKEGIVKEEAALTMFTFRRGQFNSMRYIQAPLIYSNKRLSCLKAPLDETDPASVYSGNPFMERIFQFRRAILPVMPGPLGELDFYKRPGVYSNKSGVHQPKCIVLVYISAIFCNNLKSGMIIFINGNLKEKSSFVKRH